MMRFRLSQIRGLRIGQTRTHLVDTTRFLFVLVNAERVGIQRRGRGWRVLRFEPHGSDILLREHKRANTASRAIEVANGMLDHARGT